MNLTYNSKGVCLACGCTVPVTGRTAHQAWHDKIEAAVTATDVDGGTAQNT